jgi:serine/threonine-protein kinase
MRSECCPDLSELRRVMETVLLDDEEERLAGHVVHCGRCRAALAWPDAWGEEVCLPRPGELAKPEELLLGPPDAPEQLGRVGPYQIGEVIGRGRLGVVLEGSDPAQQRRVAIKFLTTHLATDLLARARFVRAACAAATIHHDHVIAIHSVDEVAGQPYLVMEHVRGISLQERLDRDGPLPLDEVLRIGVQLATGLAAAHAKGVVHGDLTPCNVLLEGGRAWVKITDFGLADGTSCYAAPEQTSGNPVDHRADLFSLGGILQAMGTGWPPFPMSSGLGILHQARAPELSSAVPAWLSDAITTLRAPAPEDRFGCALEVARLLSSRLAPGALASAG